MWIALLVATLARFAAVDAQCGGGEIAKDPFILKTCWNLVVDAHYGFSHTEEAAFIVRTSTGRFDIVNWSASGGPDSALWVGAFPAGTIAIIHTHPNWVPSPSRIDMRTAARSRVPVYVLTRSRISKTNGSTIEIVTDGDWRPGGGRSGQSAERR